MISQLTFEILYQHSLICDSELGDQDIQHHHRDAQHKNEKQRAADLGNFAVHWLRHSCMYVYVRETVCARESERKTITERERKREGEKGRRRTHGGGIACVYVCARACVNVY